MQVATVLADTRDMTREAWLLARRKGIGGSDAAAVLGLDAYRSPLAVYADKVGDIAPSIEPPSEAALWGTLLEDVVAQEFARRNGVSVRRKNAILQHPDHPWMIADIDREVYRDGKRVGILDVKTTSAWKRDEWEDGEVPLRVVLQMQHYLAVTGRPVAFVAVLLGGQEYRQMEIARDEALIAQIIEREEAFWREHVEAHVEPAPSSPSDAEALQGLYPEATEGKTVLLPSTAREALDALSLAKADLKAATEAAKVAQATVEALLKDAEAGYLPGIAEPVVTWKTTHRASYVVKESTFRQLRLKEGVLNG